MRLLVTCLLITNIYGCKMYATYMGEVKKINLKKSGEAALLQAESEKKIAIEAAKAELESAKLKALSETERAKGVAEANKIIGDSLKGNDSYLRYLWIQGLNDGSGEVIYVPTEANLPVLEANRLKNK